MHLKLLILGSTYCRGDKEGQISLDFTSPYTRDKLRQVNSEHVSYTFAVKCWYVCTYAQNPGKVHKPDQVLEMDVCLDLIRFIMVYYRNKTSSVVLHLLR